MNEYFSVFAAAVAVVWSKGNKSYTSYGLYIDIEERAERHVPVAQHTQHMLC